jgi:hypothetical protein
VQCIRDGIAAHALVSALRFDAGERSLCLLCAAAGVKLCTGAALAQPPAATEVGITGDAGNAHALHCSPFTVGL